MAAELRRESAPLLAEEGVDVDTIDVPDMATLQRAMNRAIERRNLELFSPVGAPRDFAAATVRLVVEAIIDDHTVLAGVLLGRSSPNRRTTGWPRSRAVSASPSDYPMGRAAGRPERSCVRPASLGHLRGVVHDRLAPCLRSWG